MSSAETPLVLRLDSANIYQVLKIEKLSMCKAIVSVYQYMIVIR